MPPVPALSNQFSRAKSRALVAAQSRLISIAKDRHARIMGREPRPTGFLRIVDGRRGALEQTVKAAGLIVYIYQRSQIGFERNIRETIARLDEIARFALDTLRDLSPVVSGLYRDGHKLFRNGYPVNDLSNWKEGDEISITNYVDYSRILEVGDGKHRVPHLIYERVADIVEEKHGKDANIEFTWRGITHAMQIAQDPRRRRGFGTRVAGQSMAHNVSEHRFPTIVITPHVVSGGVARTLGAVASIGVGLLAASALSGGSTQNVTMPNAPGTIDN